MTVLITGGDGSIASELAVALTNSGRTVRTTHRRTLPARTALVEPVHLELLQPIDPRLLAGIDTVVHLAAAIDRHAATGRFEDVNAAGTRRLVEAIGSSQVRHVIFTSSLFVHGDAAYEPLTVHSPLRPLDAYAKSKLDAEQAVASLHHQRQVSILRLPLVVTEDVPRSGLATKISRLPVVPVPRLANRRAFITRDEVVRLLVGRVLATSSDSTIAIPEPSGQIGFEDTIRAAADADGRTVRTVRVPQRVFRVAHAMVRVVSGRSIAGLHADIDAIGSARAIDDSVTFVPDQRKRRRVL